MLSIHFDDMQLHIITLPRCFTVCVIQLKCKYYPVLLFRYIMPSLRNREIFVSTKQITITRCYAVQWTWVWALFNLFALCWGEKNGFIRGILAFKSYFCEEESIHSTSYWLAPFLLVYIFRWFSSATYAKFLNFSIITCYCIPFSEFNSFLL